MEDDREVRSPAAFSEPRALCVVTRPLEAQLFAFRNSRTGRMNAHVARRRRSLPLNPSQEAEIFSTETSSASLSPERIACGGATVHLE